MPVLVVAFASFILFILIVVALWVAQAAEVRERRRVQTRRSGRRFSGISIADAFDSDHALLWETQMPALELISRGGERGVPYERLLPLYNRSARCYPELYEGSSFQRWVEFLEESQLVVLTPARAFLTPEGAEFLKCRVSVGAAARVAA